MSSLPESRSAVRLVDGVALAAAALAALWPVLLNGFVNWDDPSVLVDNEHLAAPDTWSWAFTTTHMGHYQPLAWLVWSAAKSWFGLSPAAFHALSLAGHLVNGGLIYIVTLRLVERAALDSRRRRIAAVAAAALFLVHPLQVEAVAWASAFPYVLSLTALLLALLAYVHQRPMASFALYAVSLLTRANAFAFPIVLLLVDLYPLQRRRRASLVRLALEKIPFAVLAAAAVFAEWRAREVASVQDVGIGARLTMAATAPFRYVGRMLWPLHLTPLDPLAIAPTVDVVLLALAIAAMAMVAFAAWRFRDRWPALAVASLAYAVLLAPVAGLTPSGLQATADRYAYMPGVAVWMLAGVAASQLIARRPPARAAALALVAVVAAAGTLAYRQAAYWRDSITLWTRAADVDPRNDVATYNLAVALADAGRDDEAIGRYEETLRLVPDHDLARRHVANLQAAQAEREGDRLAQAGRLDEASDRYARAIALDPQRLHARAARGMTLFQRGHFADAVPELRAALEGGVKDPEVANALAFALIRRDDAAGAASVLTRAVSQHPDNVNLKHNLARLLATSPDPAVRDAPRAIRLAVEVCDRTGDRDPRALDTLAAAYAAAGQLDAARAAASRAVARARELGDQQTAAEIAEHARRYRP
jgi:tetratricopeptide (TPR) repeat protein